MSYRTYDDWKLDSGYPDEDEPAAPLPVEHKIITHYDPKPIPDRRFDWSAVTDQYDGEIDSPVGYGRTEKEARIDLLDTTTNWLWCALSIYRKGTLRSN